MNCNWLKGGTCGATTPTKGSTEKHTHGVPQDVPPAAAQHLLPVTMRQAGQRHGSERGRTGQRWPLAASRRLPITQGGRNVEDRPRAARERTW